MNSEQFNTLVALLSRLVDAFERDVNRREAEWDAMQEELNNRKQAIRKLKEMFPGISDMPEDADVVDLGDLFDQEDDDETSGD
jgi:hypothetical protein